ncbi:MAG: 3-phosphoshikimate 1-carboxyvinyltransferase [Raoultibacter sp.]
MSTTARIVTPLEKPLVGSLRVPGDKSISHRAILLAAMAQGTSQLCGVLDSEDVRSSLRAVSALGAKISLEKQPDGSLAGGIEGWGSTGPVQPEAPIDCGNSGTTARLLMGVLAPWDIKVTLTGDAALVRRPMRRVVAPLMKMGVHFEPDGQETLPLTQRGSARLKAITYASPMASAQLKSAILLAGVYAQGTTTVNEPAPSRNHTELMLPEFGARTTAGVRSAAVAGPCELKACKVAVPGDPSSAAFLICAAILRPQSSIVVENVSLNTARIGFTRTLERMGAHISVQHKGTAGKEPFGNISARYSDHLKGCEVPADKIASIVDEVPVLALVAAHATGMTILRGVSELRMKESDRLAAVIETLETLGVSVWMHGDDLFIEGCGDFSVPDNAVFNSHNDHRLAMTWALIALTGTKPVTVTHFDSVKVSYPRFLEDFERLTR